MESPKRLGFDLSQLAEAFSIHRQRSCSHLNDWLSARYELTLEEIHILEKIYAEITEDGDYWNEEELKIKGVGLLFFLADVAVKNQIKVFYERPLSEVVNGYQLSVVTDCMIATPIEFNTPRNPYFFLQEFKKGKGEKRDRNVGPPEAQMLMAMLIAQHKNADGKPIYGGYLVGANWRFTTLIGSDYCVSRQFDASQHDDLLTIVYALRHLKSLSLNR
jgi:hypothetical protein